MAGTKAALHGGSTSRRIPTPLFGGPTSSRNACERALLKVRSVIGCGSAGPRSMSALTATPPAARSRHPSSSSNAATGPPEHAAHPTSGAGQCPHCEEETLTTNPAGPTSDRVGLRRELGLVQVTASGVGIIIGAGIYVLLSSATAEAGASVWLAFV